MLRDFAIGDVFRHNEFMLWRLVFIRHGDRDASASEVDNGLSLKGREQVKGLERFIKSRQKRDKEFASGKILWFSSPKLRCQQTISPLAELVSGAKPQVDPRVDEAAFRESEEDFTQRIEEFIQELSRQNAQWVFVCSHADWLPIALDYVGGRALPMNKGAWVEYTMLGVGGELSWICPDPLIFSL